MYIDTITPRVNKILKNSDTRNPFTIAKDLGIMVLLNDSLSKLKGMYCVIKRNRIITINSNLPEQLQKIVCAHEIGHDILHRDLATLGALNEFTLYDMASRPEYEANMFAAELLIDDEDVYNLAIEGYDMQQIAAELETDINLIGLKMTNMNNRGYNFSIGLTPRGDFLKGRD